MPGVWRLDIRVSGFLEWVSFAFEAFPSSYHLLDGDIAGNEDIPGIPR